MPQAVDPRRLYRAAHGRLSAFPVLRLRRIEPHRRAAMRPRWRLFHQDEARHIEAAEQVPSADTGLDLVGIAGALATVEPKSVGKDVQGFVGGRRTEVAGLIHGQEQITN